MESAVTQTKAAADEAPPPLTDAASEIRLLFLHPGEEHEPISVELRVWKLESTPEFKAISYAWGDPELTREIYVDGKPRRVRFNCFYALWQSRLNGNCSHVWMDALCINQQDSEEKRVQIQMMGSIYAAASEVLACVGPGVEDVEFLIQFDTLQNDQWAHSQGKSQEREIHDFIVSKGLDFCNRFWHAHYAFNGRPYWNRLWIVQELAKAKSNRIFCDRKILSWQCIEIIVDCEFGTYLSVEADEKIWRLRRQRPDRLRHMRWWTAGNAMGFSETVRALGGMECEDPRDHIYGILGLITHPHGDPVIVPDYNRSPFELALQVMPCVEPSTYIALFLSLKIDAQDPAMQNLVAERRKQVTRQAPTQVSQQPRPRFTNTRYLRLEEDVDGHLTLSGLEGTMSSSPAEDSHGIIEVMKADPTLWRIGTCLAKKLFVEAENVGLLCIDARPGDVLVQIAHDIDEIVLVMRKHITTAYHIIGQGFFYTSSTARALWESHLNFTPEYATNLSIEDLAVLFGQDLAPTPGSYWTNGSHAGMVDCRERIKRLITSMTDFETNPSPMAWFERPFPSSQDIKLFSQTVD